MFGTFFAFFLIFLAILIVINISFQNFPKTSPEFKRFMATYLIPFLMMTMADWLQGPYIYSLYQDEYKLDIGTIALLFVFGFLSSMVFGTIVASLSDKFGRKFACCMYCIGYSLCCVTKHFPDVKILLIGRVLGGVSTSILFSSFESWMINEHFENGYSSEWINYTFTLQVLFNGIVAILAGQLGDICVKFMGTKTAPFDAGIVFLMIGMFIIIFYWGENYGDKKGDLFKSFSEGWEHLWKDRGTLLLGLSQSFFEAAMYIFVFMWTPVLDLSFTGYDHGQVFSIFMVAVMVGSMIFNFCSARMRLEYLLLFVFSVATICLFVPVLCIENGRAVFTCFNLFEVCVGIFWPAISSLKSIYIAENVRSTVMNYFRIPTNFFVVATLVFIKNLPPKIVFAICSCLMMVSLISMGGIIKYYSQNKKYSKS